VELDRFSSLIETLYDAALNPTDWPRVAQVFARTFGTESCAIFQLNLAQGSAGILGITGNFDAKAISDYEAYYHQKDLVAIRMSPIRRGASDAQHRSRGGSRIQKQRDLRRLRKANAIGLLFLPRPATVVRPTLSARSLPIPRSG
jgi:hypothetical protein